MLRRRQTNELARLCYSLPGLLALISAFGVALVSAQGPTGKNNSNTGREKKTNTNPASRKTSGNRGTTTRTSDAPKQIGSVVSLSGIELVLIEPGSFMMGTESPGERPAHLVNFVVNEDAAAMARIEWPKAEQEFQIARVELTRAKSLHKVNTLSNEELEAAQKQYNLAKIKLDSLRTTPGPYSFYVGKYEVKQSQWQQVMGNNPSSHRNCASCPVEDVSWEEVQEFLDKLNDANDGFRYRLPTEAEWEYACRAGDKVSKLGSSAWYKKNSTGKTHPVGQLLPNAFGLYDMLGNVWEWCLDWYHENYDEAPTDGSVWLGGIEHLRTIRGGSFYDGDDRMRPTARDYGSSTHQGPNLGFRLVAQPFKSTAQ